MGSDSQLAVGRQVLGQPGQTWRQTLSTDVVCTLSDDTHSIVYVCPVSTTALPTTRLGCQAALHQPDRALAMQFGDGLHLVEQLSPSPAAGLIIALLHLSEILRRSSVAIRSSMDIAPSVAFAFEGMKPSQWQLYMRQNEYLTDSLYYAILRQEESNTVLRKPAYLLSLMALSVPLAVVAQ